jgi:CheY-like chemotaxis protein
MRTQGALVIEARENVEPAVHVANTGANRRLRAVLADQSAQSAAVVVSLLEFHEAVDLIGRAANFEETILLVRNHQPDLVLIDLEMPLASLAIPAIILSAPSAVRVVGMCTEATIGAGPGELPGAVDALLHVDALIHKDRLQDEFPTVLDALFGSTAVCTSISSPTNDEPADDLWSRPCNPATHGIFS